MPKGNPQNLIPQAHKLTVEEASRGGVNSGKSRGEKSTVNAIINRLLNTKCTKYPQFERAAKAMGLARSENIKTLFTAMCIMNSMKKGTLDDLEKLSSLLGENVQDFGAETEIDSFTQSLREEAERLNNEHQ